MDTSAPLPAQDLVETTELAGGPAAPGEGGNGSGVPGTGVRGNPAPAAAPARDAAAVTAGDWAVCCSGGGIRSATYCLGALQAMDAGGLVGKAKWILGVSGGSYIAASRALVASGLLGQGRPGEPHAYARGTPEEENLRNNTRYLAPDAKTMLMGVLSLLLGAVVTFILAIAPLFVFGHAWGWLLRDQGVLAWSKQAGAAASVTAWTWWAAPAAAAGVTLVLFLGWWATLGSGSPGRGTKGARWVGRSASVTAILGLLMLAAPPLIARLYHSTGALGQVVRFFGFGGSGHWSPAALVGVVTAMAAVARYCQTWLAKLKQPGAAARPAGGSSPGMVASLVGWARGTLTPWLASLVVIAVGAFFTLLWIGNAAREGYSADGLVVVLAAAGVMLVIRLVADINRTSLHDFYRWRLADAYAVTRDAVAENRLPQRQELLAKAAGTRLSAIRRQDAPDLVIACTANINANRAVPAGRGGFCLAFDPEKVTLRGDPHGATPQVQANTEDYEYLLGHTRFTLFDVVAISGAAFSPLMGAATRGAYRILLTLTNLRLGVWMPHPDVVRRAREYDRAAPHPDRWWARLIPLLVIWYAGWHPFWHRDSEKAGGREARLWAHVLDLRERSTRTRGWARVFIQLRAALCWRFMQPTLGMLWAEAVGHTSYRATWVNVTDGGHYDNLALVEALRRGAKNIVVLDASGDRPNTWFTLGGAMALARADAGVDITLDPTVMTRGTGPGAAPGPAGNHVLRPWARGTFARPGSPAGAEPHGTGVAARNGHDAVAQNGHGTAGQNGHEGAAQNGQDAVAQNGHETVARNGGRPASGNGTEAAARNGDRAAALNHQEPAIPDGPLPAAGNIWVLKLGVWNGAPWDVRAYAAGHPAYPCDPTLQQLYDGAEFEAYQELGVSTAKAAVEGGLPLLLPDR
jgi:hypothetical protein